MAEDSRLGWIARNRTKAVRGRLAGAAVTEMVERLQEAAKPIELIAERLSEVVDAEFKELCRLERIENGALHFGVADTSAPAKMYRRWGEKILRALPTGLKIKRIVFAFGTRGRRID